MPSTSKGFTLVELLVVISIIAILSVAGIAVFTGVQKSARDSRRKADINAIAKAYESKTSAGSYAAIADSDFASSSKPKDPNDSKGDYFNWLSSDGSGFKACASLDNNPSNICNTPALNCYCKFSSQSTLNPSSPVNTGASTNYTIGLGGSSQSSCDTNGTLLSGLAGYWKMDEGAGWTITDSSGKGNNGMAIGGATFSSPGKIGSYSINFDGVDDYVLINNPLNYNVGDAVTIASWLKLNGDNNDPSKNYYARIVGISPGVQLAGTGSQRPSFLLIQSDHYRVTVPAALSQGAWYLVVATYDKNAGTNNQKIYLNGNLVDQATRTGPANVDSAIYIGGQPGAYLNGSIDDVRVYNRALSSGEVSGLYNSGNGCPP